MNSATEIIKLYNAASASPELSYEPVWISTDRREQDVNKTTMKYAQLGGPGVINKIGNAFGPVYKMEFVALGAISAAYIKIWALQNTDDNAPIYPVSYLIANPILDIWLKKFEFTNAGGTPVAAGGAFTIHGHRKQNYPLSF